MKRTSYTTVVGFVLCTFASSSFALTNDSDQPINIRAKNVDANEKNGISIYCGNVVLTQGSLRLQADRLEVRTSEHRAEVIMAWGKPVQLDNVTDTGEKLHAEALRAEYHATERRID